MTTSTAVKAKTGRNRPLDRVAIEYSRRDNAGGADHCQGIEQVRADDIAQGQLMFPALGCYDNYNEFGQ